MTDETTPKPERYFARRNVRTGGMSMTPRQLEELVRATLLKNVWAPPTPTNRPIRYRIVGG